MSSSTSPRATPRQGIALPIALGAIVLLGALVAGVFFAATQEYRVGRGSIASQQVATAAEVGLASVISSWTRERTNATKVGRSVTQADTTIDGVTVKRRWSRVTPTMFWVTVTAVGGSGRLDTRAKKQLNGIMRVETPDLPILGAVTGRGKTEVAGSSRVSGNDTVPSGWECPPGSGQIAGVVVNDSATNFTNPSTKTVITGTPQVKDSTAMVRDTMTFTNFGGFDYNMLAAAANKVFTGGGTFGTIGPKYNLDGTCNIADQFNWGEQSLTDGDARCADYMPTVHLRGDNVTYQLDGGLGGAGGAGILLVDGHLNMAGKFIWNGLIIVRGRVRITGSATDGPRIIGAIAAMNRNSPDSTNLIAGGSQTTFSSCAVQQVTSRHGTAKPLRFRAWADVSF